MKNLERVARTGGPNGWPKQPHGFSRRVKQEPQKSDALAGYTARENFRTGKRERHYGLRNNSKGLWNVDAENSFTAWLSFRMDTLFVSFAAETPKFLVDREHSLQSSLKLKETQTRKSK